MKLGEVRAKYLEYFKKRGHTVIPSASLVPDNDPTTLFTGSGMQPLLPYLLGAPHPQGKRLVDSQKAFRSGDIEEVGDNRHTTFFEMLGNWSLGDYFKEEQLRWFFEFLTDEVGLDPRKLYVTVFAGDTKNNVPKDTEAAAIWKSLFAEKGIDAKEVELLTEKQGNELGMQGGRIFYFDAKKNWWSRSGVPETMPSGEPGGPDSEVFYDFGTTHDPKFGRECHPNCDCGRFMEIGNSVFMQYKKNADGTFSELPQRNVDFGGGLERIAAASEHESDVFRIDVFQSIVRTLEIGAKSKYGDDKSSTAAFRIIADHMRAASFLIADGVIPSNTERGYFLRRLIRRSVRYADKLGVKAGSLGSIYRIVATEYGSQYPELVADRATVIDEEEGKFRQTLEKGLKEFEKGTDPFVLFTTFGFPFELTEELAKEKGRVIDEAKFRKDLEEHQKLSRVGSEQKFKGGLGDTSEKSLRYHTATHLLHQALRTVLGEHVQQKGSNITPERLRFDFAHPQKMTDDEKKGVEDLVNQKIREGLPVTRVVLPKAEAEKTGALHFFGEKYGDEVSVYYIGNSITDAFSKEFCGGPHVANTKELGIFKIAKEEAVSAGVRRIKAVLE